MKKIDTLSQRELLDTVREAVDAVRISDPLSGPSPAARRRLRRIIRENPHSIRALHIRHNLGKVRAEWLETLVDAELERTWLIRCEPLVDNWDQIPRRAAAHK